MKEIDIYGLTFGIETLIGWAMVSAAALLGWIKAHRASKRARAAEQVNENAIRHALGPDLQVIHVRINGADKYFPNEPLPAFADGSTIRLEMGIYGAGVRRITDDQPKPYGLQPPKAGSLGDDFFNFDYKYNAANAGTPSRFTITFLTEEGIYLTQIYEYIHGGGQMKMIDPP